MAEPKIKPAKRVAGKSKFRLPERTARIAEINPLRELLQEAKAQEAATVNNSMNENLTSAKQIAGVSQFPALNQESSDISAILIAGVSALPDTEADTGKLNAFEEFVKKWTPILRSGQLSICRTLFEMTYAVGQTECFTSMPKLAAAAGLKVRQCYNVITQLELLGFISRPDTYNTSNKKGTIFRLHLSPQPPSSNNRRYHIGSIWTPLQSGLQGCPNVARDFAVLKFRSKSL